VACRWTWRSRVAGFSQVDEKPEHVLDNVKPGYVVGGHWEDFSLAPGTRRPLRRPARARGVPVRRAHEATWEAGLRGGAWPEDLLILIASGRAPGVVRPRWGEEMAKTRDGGADTARPIRLFAAIAPRQRLPAHLRVLFWHRCQTDRAPREEAVRRLTGSPAAPFSRPPRRQPRVHSSDSGPRPGLHLKRFQRGALPPLTKHPFIEVLESTSPSSSRLGKRR
jgi:hypothetical protein